MDEDELRRTAEGEATVGGIEVAPFDSQKKLREWVACRAPAFAGGRWPGCKAKRATDSLASRR